MSKRRDRFVVGFCSYGTVIYGCVGSKENGKWIGPFTIELARLRQKEMPNSIIYELVEKVAKKGRE